MKAQTGANLVLGLDELVYSKGNLDTELISQIIAGKQKELKTEFMKRFVLRNFNQGSFAFSNFMASSLDLLLNEKNKKVVTREIMEHATNLALVYGFAEMYLQAEWRKNKDSAKLHPIFKLKNINKYLDPKIKTQWLNRVKGYSKKPSLALLYTLKKSKDRKNREKKFLDRDNSNLNQIFIDLVYDACRESDVVKAHGFFKQDENVDQSVYESQSLYHRYKYSTDFKDIGDYLLVTIHSDVKHKIEVLFTYYGLIKRLKKELTVKSTGKDSLGISKSNDLCVIKSYKDKKDSLVKIISKKYYQSVEFNTSNNSMKSEVIIPVIFQIKKILKNIDDFNNITRKLKRLTYKINIEQQLHKNESKLSFKKDTLLNELILQYSMKLYDIEELIKQYNYLINGKNNNSVKNIELDSISINKINIEGYELPKLKLDIDSDSLSRIIDSLKTKSFKLIVDSFFDSNTINNLRKTVNSFEENEEKQKNVAESNKKDSINKDVANNLLTITIKKLKDELLAIQNKDSNLSKITPDELETIKKLYTKVLEIENFKEAAINYAFIDSLESKILPNLLALNIKYGNFKEIINSLNNLKDAGFYLLVEKFVSNDELKNFIHLGDQMVNFIAKIDELNEAQTYSHILDLIVDAGFIYENTAAGQVINTVVNGLNKYTEIDEKANTLTLDLESLVLKMYKMYAEKNQSSKVEVYFSVGMNQSFVIGDKSPYLFNSEQSQNNISFVGEKLGVKLKLFNFGKKRLDIYGNQIGYTSNKGYLKGIKDLSEKEELKRQKTGKPLVSDIYGILYSSGLLYNLVNLSTESNFKGALFGTGLGVSFFNGLDINFSAAVSSEKFFNTSSTPVFLNLGFDIKIFEYLEALSEKQKLKKQEKLKADVLSIEDNSK